MNQGDFDDVARTLGAFASRRTALGLLGMLGAAGGALLTHDAEQAAGKGKKGKKRKRCGKDERKCGKKCVKLTSNTHCGGCGQRCTDGATCLDGACCGSGMVNCRGNCRPDCPPPVSEEPFPGHGAYGLNKPSLWSQAQLDDHVRSAYTKWKARYLLDAGRDGNGDGMYRVAKSKDGPDRNLTVSEGQGYGMVITALMAGFDPEAQELFDGLWRFRLAHPSEIDNRLMDWEVPKNSGNNSAFDGDSDIAYGLLLADAQFGSGGAINYKDRATWVISGILASTIGPASGLPMLGDWVNPNGNPHNQYTTRPSDYMLAHFRAFRRATGDGVWDTVIANCQAVITSLQANYAQATGLVPDFEIPISASDHSPKPAYEGFLEQHDGDYYYNAGRVPWRVGIHALLNNDATAATQMAKITNWAKATTGGDPQAFRAGYRLDGSTWSGTNYFTTFFVAPLGVAAMSTSGAQDWLNAIYAAVYDRQENYYEDSVTLLCLLVMTGNFWDPTAV